MPDTDNREWSNLSPNENSERVVVDEVFEDGNARLLRAPRLPNHSEDDLSIDTWGEEKEDFIKSWRVEAFVGFSSKQFLNEGDVFFVVDGRRLTSRYTPIPRIEAKHSHLLLPWGKSREWARNEIKKQFYKLAAVEMAEQERGRKLLFNRIDKKFAKEYSSSK